MAVIKSEIRSGIYYDSAVLMQLQRSMSQLEGVQDAGVVMGTEENKEILAHIDLVNSEVNAAKPDDMVIVIRAENEAAALSAIEKVDELLTRKRSNVDQDYRPKSLEGAADMLPDASWVLISVAGRFAAGVARKALELGKHVFLFSDNVSVEDEISLKKTAAEKGLLVMGPDCGTAMISGIGLGFANKIRKGPIGVVAAAGTGLQQVTTRIHQLGSGITHGIGTGGRDLKDPVGAATFLMALDVLARDPETKVITLVSKPPAPQVAEKVIRKARQINKPVVINFIARKPTSRQEGNLWFATGMDDAAALSVQLAQNPPELKSTNQFPVEKFAKGQRYFRGLFSGGTLAYEAQFLLEGYIGRVWANAPINKENKLKDSLKSEENCIVDLGEDEFTVGRLHPMMDNEMRIRRLLEESRDPEVAVIMLDVVIGFGSHPDPASELAPAIVKAKQEAENAGRYLEVVVVATGTDEDPQNLDSQVAQLRAAGAWVSSSNEEVVNYAGSILRSINQPAEETFVFKPVDLETLSRKLEAINVGLESFAENLLAQETPTVHVDWRPPAGGNEKLANILERMKKFS
ncbi:MAG: FdrA family protein [Chloroflexi bacterium HGW-Chloroflexi-8]|jgi:FdrA protein|nr:MAG: FdrA family protein [Chloroflexi bacterium HGW-Chloroflexi-8]